MKITRVKYKDIEQIPYLKVKKDFKQNFQGSAPAPFIGRFGYPNVNIGLLSPQIHGDLQEYNSPRLWNKQNYQVGQIASLRYDLVNSRTKWDVKTITNNKFLQLTQETGMAKKAVDIEINLKKLPKLNTKPEREITPFGPASEIQKARLTSNPKIDQKVEKVVYDTDLKANKAINYLHKKGFEEAQLSKLLSTANIGIKHNRKLVPTRWSITAVDDTVGKQLITEIKDQPTGDYQAYFGGGWGNYYLFLFFPEVWSYELFETYLYSKVNPWSKQGYMYSTDYENYQGRKKYAQETAGGYYAARISLLEKIKKNKRQSSCIALRFITDEYKIPLGVWICRESSRKSLNTIPITFSSQELMFKFAESLIKNKFGFDIHQLLSKSKLLKEKKQQTRLNNFIS